MNTVGNSVAKIFLYCVIFGLSVVASAKALYTEDRIYEYGAGIPSAYKYFVQVMGGETETAARVRYACLRKVHPSLATAIFEVPTEAGFKPKFPFSVVVASYVSQVEANEVLNSTRQNLDYMSIASCLGISDPDIDSAVTLFKKDTFIFDLKVNSAKWTKSKERSPVAPFNGAGEIRFRNDDSPRKALVEGKRYDSPQAISAAISSYRGRFPGIHFVAIQHGPSFFLSVTSIVGDRGLQGAMQAMREVGAYSLTATAQFEALDTSLVTPVSVKMVDIVGRPLPLPPPITRTGDRISTAVLESEDLFETLPARVKRCSDGTYSDNGSSVRDLASCSGVVLTSVALTRCLLESDCQGARVPVGFAMPQVDLVASCLAQGAPVPPPSPTMPASKVSPTNACQATTLDPVFLSIIDKAGLRVCLVAGSEASEACLKARSVLKDLCGKASPAPFCNVARDVVAEADSRVDSLIACLNGRSCNAVVPRPPAVEALVANEAAKLGTILEARVGPVKEALGMLTADATTAVAAFKECVALREANNQPAASTCFVKLGLAPGEITMLDCAVRAPNEPARALCVAPSNGPIAGAVSKAQCAREARNDIAALAACAGGDAAKISASYQCAAASSSITDVALRCTDAVPKEVALGIQCAQKQDSVTGYLGCLPNLSGREKAAACLAVAKDDGERVGCVATNLPMDPQVARTLGCVSGSNGNSAAMAACIAGPLLPPEVARAASCAASSTGATDFALCAAGTGLNPELRIAAECAVSTGGAPPAFAACAAGRLTVRELGKCLSGEIGKEGGCFGPNNELVKAFNTQINDVLRGPGEGNDLRVALGKITEPLKSLGGAVSSGLQKLADDAKRGDVGRTICNWFGC